MQGLRPFTARVHLRQALALLVATVDTLRVACQP